MRDLHKTLKLFDTDVCAMEYCSEFDELKSILEHCDRDVKPFNKLHFRGGNEAFINELTRRLQQMLVERQLVHPDTREPLPKAYNVLRKILVFLLVNTDATYKYNLRDDVQLANVMELCPLLPKFLLVTLVWELRLDKFFYEALSYTPCWFSFQYFEPATDSLKYLDDPYAVLDKVEQLVGAIFLSITRSNRLKMDQVDKKIIYGKLYDYTMNLLRQFYTPDAEKFKKFNKNEFFRYSGFALKHILQMVLFAFDNFESLEEAKSPDEIFNICRHLQPKSIANVANVSSESKEHELKIVTALINSLQYNVMLVKIDVFMYWVEVDLTPSQNLQMAIGEMAYKVGERMVANRAFAHDIEPQLQMIAIRPKTLEEILREATIGEILHNLDDRTLSYPIKKSWFDELFNRTLAFGNDECLQSITDNIKLMSVESCQQILDYIKLEIQRQESECQEDVKDVLKTDPNCTSMMEIDYEEFSNLTRLLLLSLAHFKNDEILSLLIYQAKVFSSLSANICTHPADDDFNARATEFLNKFAASFDLQQFLILCFEHPELMWSKFFDCACHNSAHVKNFCATVRETRPFSNSYFNTLLNNAMCDSNKIQQKYFPELLCEIYFVLYAPERKTDFFKQFVNKNVQAMLDSQQFEELLPIVKALNLIGSHGETQSYKPLNFGEVTAPVLLMGAQIMDKTRWDLITYTEVRDEIVRECIQFIQNTSKKFLPVATEKDRKWISKVIKDSYRAITQYYFQKFSLTPDHPTVNFDRFLIRLEIENKSEAEMFLIMNYVRCTMKETEWLARSERLLPHISDVMLILSGVVIETDNSNAVNNYRHCLANYANIVIKFILPKIENETKRVEKLEMKVLKILASAPAQIYEEVFISFEWLLLEIIKKCARPLDESTVKSIRKFVGTMKECRAKDIFMDKFQALVSECMT